MQLSHRISSKVLTYSKFYNVPDFIINPNQSTDMLGYCSQSFSQKIFYGSWSLKLPKYGNALSIYKGTNKKHWNHGTKQDTRNEDDNYDNDLSIAVQLQYSGTHALGFGLEVVH